MSTPEIPTSGDYADAYPNSSRVFDGSAVPTPAGLVPIRVPRREVRLAGGEPPVRLYDTSGPKVTDVREGLPTYRRHWILVRNDVEEIDVRMTRPEDNGYRTSVEEKARLEKL